MTALNRNMIVDGSEENMSMSVDACAISLRRAALPLGSLSASCTISGI